MTSSAGSRNLLLSEIFPPAVGGSGRWFHEIYLRLPSEQTVVFTEVREGSAEVDATSGLTTIREPFALRDTGSFSLKGVPDYASLAGRVAKVCRAYDVGTIHCGRCVPEGWVAWLLKLTTGRPYVCFAHGEEVNLPKSPDESGVMSSRQHRIMGARALHGAALVIANSENTARILKEDWRVAENRVVVLHPGCDMDRFRPAPPDAARREAWGWTDRTVILTVGRLQTRKGHDTLIAAMPAIRQAIPNVLYAIVGRGEERERLHALVEQHGVADCVRFYENMNDDDLVASYQQCDLFVLPNRQVGSDIEGFGMVLVEAQACGKPVVAGNSGGTAETMAIGETGLIVDATQPGTLATSLIALLCDSDRMQRFAAAARPYVETRFGWESLSKEAARLFASVKR
jgi:phosphatidylinositol alpha-1,6-mannosyltransferase